MNLIYFSEADVYFNIWLIMTAEIKEEKIYTFYLKS